MVHRACFKLLVEIECGNVEQIPVQFIFRELQGVIVTLDETGYLHCAYLGTDPSMMVTPAPESRDINYEVSGMNGFIKVTNHRGSMEPSEPITRREQSK